jgi:hypothetical protein
MLKFAWLITYSSPEGREDELPQFNKSTLKAQMPTSTNTPPLLFNIHSPSTPGDLSIGSSGDRKTTLVYSSGHLAIRSLKIIFPLGFR